MGAGTRKIGHADGVTIWECPKIHSTKMEMLASWACCAKYGQFRPLRPYRRNHGARGFPQITASRGLPVAGKALVGRLVAALEWLDPASASATRAPCSVQTWWWR